ncbi:peptidylprolyl isomerase [Sulfurovum sp. zt1-1]|uniref:Peptidylprolyl isomerase n=1 Tax=Sulfurovum zhangzhouensis TaxID=3019067 RepID=A0ABT7QWB6_9BACT|nr:peptidylprolyl isomerase [Sulfurovum zhangzhouensis]MDM5271125.1 peptidylprolyl isomerase [Sulfurovum zhangzhouensis]
MFKFAKTSLLVAAAALSLSASDVLLTVNGKNITKQDAQLFVSAAAPNANYADLKSQEQDMIKERLIEKVLFSELAQQEGIENDPEFKKNLEMLKSELAINVWMKKQLDNVVVSDSEAKEFYEKNSDKFLEEATLHARHILVESEQDAQKIIDTLKPLQGKVLQEKFIELAKTQSTGPSGPNGGDLGTFKKGQMVPAFSEAVWALEEGKITTKPVKTRFGYHVIYLEKKNEASTMAYEDVKPQIIATLRQKQFTTKIQEIAKELKKKATIIDPEKKEDKK